MNEELHSESAFTYAIKTMGCKANVYDSLVLENELIGLGGTRNIESPDVFIMNSCTVTNGADQQCDSELKQVKKKHPKALTLLTGCYAQVAQSQHVQKASAHHIVDNSNKARIKLILAQHLGIEAKDVLNKGLEDDVYWGQLPTFAGKTRAFLKIQEGCNDFCTYCIIPFARGKSRSVKKADVLSEIRRLESEGIREVVLTGINIADYGLDFESTFEDLVESILTETTVSRIRLSSLDPSEISEHLITLMKTNERLMPHFHVSLQSPVTRVLRAMKRKYNQEDVISTLTKIKEELPHAFVGMDVITGFNSETKEEHEEAVHVLKKLPWTRLHVFPYSEREGTSALKIKGKVPVHERRERAKELLELSRERHGDIAKTYVGSSIKRVLFESPHEIDGHYYLIGHSDNYFRVLIDEPFQNYNDARRFMNTVHDLKTINAVAKPAEDWTLEAKFISGESRE